MRTSRKQLTGICLIKIAYAFFAVLVFARFTSLGDTGDYLKGEYLERNNLASTAYLMSLIGAVLGNIGSFIFSLILSVWGMVYLLNKADFSAENVRLAFVLMALPSFGVWTSILSKEVFVLFSFCLCTGGLIDLLKHRRVFFSLLQLLGLALLTFIKPHYAVCIYLSALGIIVFRIGFRRELLLALLAPVLIVTLALAIHYIDLIYQYTQIIPIHFSVNGGSTRPNDVWVNKYDFFTYLPVGLPVSFIGPTLSETVAAPKMLPFFLEGIFLAGFVVLYSWRAVFCHGYMNVLGLTLLFTFTFALLLSHYPFGLFNPGTAVRYRSGFIFPMCLFILYIAEGNRRLFASSPTC